VPSQEVAPQAPPAAHGPAQQLPVPETPQTPLVHWSFAEHAAPGALFATQAPAEQ
jgi:hypothetical protein